MNSQAALFDLVNPPADPEPLWAPIARNSDPTTSHAAAEHAALKAGTNRAIALRALAEAGSQGLTDFELARVTSIQQTSIGKRRGELARIGLVESAGITRPSPSGSPAIVWRITAKGREAA